MTMFSFLRRRSALRASQRKCNIRPRLEALEDRCVPTTWVVHSGADDGSSGTLRKAISDAHNGDTIEIVPAVHSIVLTQGELLIEKDLTIEAPVLAQGLNEGHVPHVDEGHVPDGGKGPIETRPTISGNNSSRVFEIAAGHLVTLSNLIITGGNIGIQVAADEGGAIFNSGTLTVSHSALSGNTNHLGGGIFNNAGGTVWVDDSTVDHNTAAASQIPVIGGIGGPGGVIGSGGGGGGTGFVTVPGAGGGIYNLGVLHVVDGSILAYNIASGDSFLSIGAASAGGGIYNGAGGSVTISHSAVSANTATVGGGIYNLGAMTVEQFSGLSQNTAHFGGAIYNDVGGTVTVSDSRLSYNTAIILGGAIYNAAGALDVKVSGSTFTQNDIFGPWDDLGGNIFN
jgi:hypothetical protein